MDARDDRWRSARDRTRTGSAGRVVGRCARSRTFAGVGEGDLGMCGVCGIWSPREQATADPAEAARLMFFSLYALQHRGQESAGIAATDGRDLRVVRRMGLVGQVFSEPDLGVLTGRAAMGYTRYSTTGASKIQNAQPFTVRAEGLGELAIGHNGNCINAREIRDALAEDGVHFVTSSDTEVVAQAIVHAQGTSWDEQIGRASCRER